MARDLRPGRYSVQVDFPGFETLVIPDVRVGRARTGATRCSDHPEARRVGARSGAIRRRRLGSAERPLQHGALEGPDRGAARRPGRDGARAPGDGGPGRDDPGGRLPRRAAAAEVADPLDPLLARHVCGRAPRRRHGLRRHRHAAGPRAAARGNRLQFPRRRAERAQRVSAAEGAGADAAVHLQPERHAAGRSGRRSRCRPTPRRCTTRRTSSRRLPDGARATPVRRPSDRHNFNARHRSRAQQGAHAAREPAAERRTTSATSASARSTCPSAPTSARRRDRILRLSENGPWGSALFGETRLQLRWQSVRVGVRGGGADRSACSTPSRPAARSRPAAARRPRSSGPPTWTGRGAGTRSAPACSIEGGFYNSDSRTNYLGTFTFASLADFEAGRPPPTRGGSAIRYVRYSQWQAGSSSRTTGACGQNLTLSAGLRKEFQTNLDDTLNLAPRGGLTWSPFAHGRTTVRAGGGIFYDWLESETYEQTLRVDGQRQQELVIRNPGYPRSVRRAGRPAGAAGQQVPALAGSRHAAAGDGERRRQPAARRRGSARTSASRTARGSNRLRGRLLNAPGPDGVRPDPTVGNITQVESTASSREPARISAG
jgi:hypothetical protein